MARPRKDQGDSAEQRIKDSFWGLLQQHNLNDITVSMITAQAKCNRGTFYYHYNSLEELIEAVIQDELFIANSVPRALFYLFCFKADPFEEEGFALHIKRFGLMMNRGDKNGINIKVKEAVVGIWENLLCEPDEELTLDTRLVSEYVTSGLIGLIAYLHREGLLEDCDHMPDESKFSFKTNAQYLVSSVSNAQNIPVQELEKRICRQLQTTHIASCESCSRALLL